MRGGGGRGRSRDDGSDLGMSDADQGSRIEEDDNEGSEEESPKLSKHSEKK
jgi:hypothetical protein